MTQQFRSPRPEQEQHTLYRIPVARPTSLLTPWLHKRAIERAALYCMSLQSYLDMLVLRDIHSDAQAERDLWAQVEAQARMEAQTKKEQEARHDP